MDTVSLIIHVTAAALLVGPQVLLFLAVVPSTWLIEDERLRRDVTRVVTARFGMISSVALAALLATGLYQFYQVVPEFVQDDLSGFRFGPIFILKMTLFTLLVILIAVHALVFGRRISRLSDAVIADPEDETAAWELDTQRRWSFLLAFAMVLVSLAVLFLGVTLGHHEYSYVAN
jgi:uncharacterized membrane protein